MKSYENFDEIERDLQLLRLEKNIALEELKLVKHNFNESLSSLSWITIALKYLSKYGFLFLIKKIFK